MTAGGKRKGAGRPALPKSEQAVAVTVRVRPSIADASRRGARPKVSAKPQRSPRGCGGCGRHNVGSQPRA